MQRFRLLLCILALIASGCGDDDVGVAADGGSTTTSEAPSSSTTSSTTTSTTTTSTTTTRVPQGMCGDLIPVVTESGTDCVDPNAPSDGPVGFPDLLVAEDGDLTRYTYDDEMLGFESSLFADHLVTAIHQTPSGVIFTREDQRLDETEHLVEIVRYDPDGTRTVVDGLVDIYDVAVIGGVEVVIGSVAAADGFGFGGVSALAVEDGREIADFGLGAEAEFGVTDFMWSEAAGVGVASAWADLTEWVGFVDLAGGAVALPSPTDDLAYNAPPYVTAATISLDGSTLYWVEGPDWGFDPDTDESGPIAAAWVLRSADLRTGEERLYWPLSEPVLDATVLNIESIEDLGGWILINRSVLQGVDPEPLAPLVLDFTVEEPELFTFPAIGLATLAGG